MAEKTLTIAMRLDGNKETVGGIQQATTALTKLSKEQLAVGAAAQKTGKQKIDFKDMAANSNNARESMLNLQYSLRDSPYLFQSLQMGVTAAGENIGLLVQSMVSLKGEAGGVGNAVGVLKAAMSGPGGIGVAISAVLFIVQSATFIFAKLKKNAKESGEAVEAVAWSWNALSSSVEDTQKVLDQLSFKQVSDGIRILNDEYAKLQKTQDELVKESEEFFDPTGAGFVDEENLAALKKSIKTEKEILEKQAAIRSKILQAAGEGKISASKIDELMPVFEQELARRQNDLKALSERARKKFRKDREDAVKAIQDQIDKLNELKNNLGDVRNIELEIAQKRDEFKDAKGDAARRAIFDEIKALEELQNKYEFKEDKEKAAGKSRTGKSAAELDAEYEAKRAALEAQLAVLRGERTELEVLAAREQALNEERVTANKERQQEIELELLNIAIERENIGQRTAAEREKEAKAHEDALEKIAKQQRKNELARGENTLLTEGATEQNAIQARLNMQMAAFNARKQSLQDELSAVEQTLQSETDLEQSEIDKRLLMAEQMKGQIIEIEGQILKAKQQAADQAAAAEERAAQTRMQAAMSLGSQFANSSMTLFTQMSQSMAQQEQQRTNAYRTQLEQDRDAALSKTNSEQQRASIQKKYDDEIAANDAALKAKQAKEQTRMFQFQQGITFVTAQMNAIATYPKVMEQMGPFGPAVAPIMVAIALAQAARILTYKAPGYAAGGRPIKVSNGESYLDEDTFQKLLPQVMMLNKSQQIRGAGTGTSDSIFAMADGGFVLNAETTRKLRGFADGGDVLNRDLALPDSPSVAVGSGVVEAINNLSQRMDRFSSLVMWYIKNPPPSKAVLDTKQSAAVLSAAEYDINRSRLQ